MQDAKLIAACIHSRRAWERVAPHFTGDDFTPLSKFWWEKVCQWYKLDTDSQRIDKSLLMARGESQITNPKHKESLLGFMSALDEPASAENAAQIALELKRYTVGMQFASAIAGQDSKKISELLPKYRELQEATELPMLKGNAQTVYEDAADWDSLDDIVGQGKRIKLYPTTLIQRTNGGALPGHAILVFGRSDSGKSTFTINLAAGFLRQELRTLYLGNEENINVLKARMRNRLAGMTPEEVSADPAKANKLARDRAKDNLHMRHLHRATMDDVDRAVREFEPQVVILDQLRGVGVQSADKMTQRLEAVAVEWRSLLNTYGLVGVSVTQANDRTQSYGQQVPTILTQSDIDSSRTGVPGAQDLIIGVGVDEELRQRNQRMISIAKSKLSSKPDAKDPFVVDMDLARCIVKG